MTWLSSSVSPRAVDKTARKGFRDLAGVRLGPPAAALRHAPLLAPSSAVKDTSLPAAKLRLGLLVPASTGFPEQVGVTGSGTHPAGLRTRR